MISEQEIRVSARAYLGRFSKSWQVQLGHQIKDLPDFNTVKISFLRFTRSIESLLKDHREAKDI